MIYDIVIPLIAVGAAELGDKTQLAILCLASKTRQYLYLFLGVILAFAITDGLAIVLGDTLTKFVPEIWIKAIAGLVFIAFGIAMLLKKEEEEGKCDLKSPFYSGFTMILLCEMGDKTQIASGLFAAQYNPWLVFLGVMLALASLSVIAILLGQWLITKIDRKMISKIAGSVFIAIGIGTIAFAIFA